MSHSFENVRLLIADPSQMVRAGLKAALHSFGFRTINDTNSFVKLHDLLAQDAVDMLIAASELEGNNVGFLVQELRNQRLGTNPFPVVVVLLSSAEPDYVRQVIDSGADDLLLTPVVPDQLMTRIQKVGRTRKPFVVTHDYTGPDRRTRERAFKSGQPGSMIEVPNPLKSRAQDGMDGTRLQHQIEHAAVSLNLLKIERYAVQIDWLVNHVLASVRDGIAEGSDVPAHIARLVQVCDDMGRRVKGTASEGASNAITEVRALAKTMESAPAQIAYATVERLAELARHVTRSIGKAPVAKAG